jgi:hypothetical protein
MKEFTMIKGASFCVAILLTVVGACAADDAAKPDSEGFVSLFDGKTINGWEGLPGIWSVKDGAIDGTQQNQGSKQTDLILTDSEDHPEKYKDFELHLKYRLLSNNGNSGIQFRSKINDPPTLHVGGYQADIDDAGRYTGSIYDESGIAGGRNTMSNLGEKTVWDKDNKRHNTPLGESAADLKKAIHLHGEEWNDIVLKVEGNHVVYSINGHVTTEMTDESPKAVLTGGVLAFQIHRGFTMQIQYKDIKIKMLK